MKAVLTKRYGAPKTMEVAEVPIPKPGENEVLIRIVATSVNSGDWHLQRGEPKMIRLGFGLFKPNVHILGNDVAGIVSAVGAKVTKFKVNDEVFGELEDSGFGGFAEYTCCKESHLILKPKDLSFEQAGALAGAGMTALQGIRDNGKASKGSRVLINGASGGVGSFAVQIAKYYGAEVTAVCSGAKADMVRSLKPDYLIDYNKEDFTKSGKKYDLILDAAAYGSLRKNVKALTPKGRYVLVGGSTSALLKTAMFGSLFTMGTSKKALTFLVSPKVEDLAFLKDLLQNGALRVPIDRTFKLSEVPEAMQYLEDRRVQGKIAINAKAL